MKKVGLTGNIGSGKTTICRVFEMLDVPVFYADRSARQLLNREDVTGQLVQLFGEGILMQGRKIDRSALAAIVFSDRRALQRLNGLIHPLVRDAFMQWAASQQARYVIMEAAILFESGFASHFDHMVLVAAEMEARISRVVSRDGVGREDVKRRMEHQRPQEELIPLSDFVIYNDDNMLVIPQILRIDHAICAAAGKNKIK